MCSAGRAAAGARVPGQRHHAEQPEEGVRVHQRVCTRGARRRAARVQVRVCSVLPRCCCAAELMPLVQTAGRGRAEGAAAHPRHLAGAPGVSRAPHRRRPPRRHHSCCARTHARARARAPDGSCAFIKDVRHIQIHS